MVRCNVVCCSVVVCEGYASERCMSGVGWIHGVRVTEVRGTFGPCAGCTMGPCDGLEGGCMRDVLATTLIGTTLR